MGGHLNYSNFFSSSKMHTKQTIIFEENLFAEEICKNLYRDSNDISYKNYIRILTA